MEIVYAWVASIASAISPLIIKGANKQFAKNPLFFNILRLVVVIPFSVTLALFCGGGLPSDWLAIFGVGACLAAFYVLFVLALYDLDVSVMAPLFSLRAVFSVVIGVFIVGESVSWLGWLLVGVIVGASSLATYDEKTKFRALLHWSIILAVLAMLALAFMGYFAGLSFRHNGFATTLLWQDSIALLLLLPSLLCSSVRKEFVSWRKFYLLLPLGVIGLVYNAASLVAYGHNLAVSSVIVSLPLSMIFVVLLSLWSRTALEKHPLKTYVFRFTGATLMVGCAIWLSLL